jgi:hypothetical protein
VYTAPNPTDIITRLSASFTVPPKPAMPLGEPAFWFGVQTAAGDGALIQPIMSKWLGNSWCVDLGLTRALLIALVA